MSKSERKHRARRAHADTTTRRRQDSFAKMSLCRACLVLLDTENTAHDLYQEKDLAAKLIGCLGASVGLRFLGAPPDTESSPKIVLKCICECCYQLVMRFYDFQRMCEESYRNFEKLMAEVNSQTLDDYINNEDEKHPEAMDNLLKIPKEEILSTEDKPFSLESTEDIEEVYIMENNAAKKTLEKESLKAITTSRIAKRPPGVRHRLICTICGRGFYKMYNYEAHMQMHQGKQPYKCTFAWCDKIYTRANLLKDHLRKAHQIDTFTYVCIEPDCKQVFTELRSLRYHVNRQHTKDFVPKKNKHVCDTCGKSYGRAAHLTRHKWVHRSKLEYRFACDQCDKRFYTKENLNDHVARQHDKSKAWRCKQCLRTFLSRLSFAAHMRFHKRSTWD